MTETTVLLLGAAVDSGKRQPGCLMGPAAYRTAGIAGELTALGHEVRDLGDLPQPAPAAVTVPRDNLHAFAETVAWTEALTRAAREAAAEGLPVFLGGDHSLSLGTVTGVAEHAAAVGRPLFVLWLDAHADYHTAMTTQSGNLHGTPVAYLTGRDGFPGFPQPAAPVPHDRVAMIGLRSVDPEERQGLAEAGVHLTDMRAIDEGGIARPLAEFLARVSAEGGMLHVSLDVDFLDPEIAPAVGTTVPGGATFREAHLAMEMLCDSGLVTSLDLVELNPFLDERGRTARLMVELTGSLFGRRIFDRPTRSY